MSLTEKMALRFAAPEPLRSPKARPRLGRLEGWASIVVNTVLFLGKLLIGLWINSIALIADSVHSLSDVATSVIVIIGYRISEKPADREHPFGHQRAEYIATLIIAILLAVAGVEFIRTAYHRLGNPKLMAVNFWVLIFIFATIAIKAWLGIFSKQLGGLIDSAALKADAYHHYSDALSSILVLVAVVGSKFGYTFLDGVGGITVGLILIWAGLTIAKDVADPIIGKPPAPELILEIQKICQSIKSVINTHDIVVHSYGARLFISVHVEVDQKKSSTVAHEIADAVETALEQQLKAYSTVHVDPVNTDSAEVKLANDIVQQIVAESRDIRAYHDLRLVQKPNHQLLIFDLVPENPVHKKCEDFDKCQQLRSELLRAFPNCEIRVNVDPVYIFN
jgi:cation diffusion facilitator family transporter